MISQREMSLQGYLKLGLLASLFVHFLFALLLNAPPRVSQAPLPLVFDVVFEKPEPKAPQPPREIQRQIVSPPEKNEPLKTDDVNKPKFLSDVDANAKHEQLKRGIDPRAGKAVSKYKMEADARSEEKLAAREPAAKAPAARERKPLKQLSLDSQTLLQEFSGQQASNPKGELNDLLQAAKPQSASGSAYRAFSRPMGSGAAFLGLSGSPDFLPNLPDGDITLLNTKASLNAVFVRRVATLVFGELRAQGWDSLRAGDIFAVTAPSVVRAILSPQGKLISARLESSSSSPRFDEILQGAVQKGARDSNPPKEAQADDGNFHFIFEAKSWSRPALSPRTGAPTERRWLLLSTGLE